MNGLYIREGKGDGTHPTDCCIGATEVEGWTQREGGRAKAARKFYHDLNSENSENMKVFIRSNLAKNVPTTMEDLNLAKKIFGKDVATCKGKWTKQKPRVVLKEDIIEFPVELNAKGMEVNLATNIVAINNKAFLHALDRRIKNASLVALSARKNGKGYNK